MSELFQPKKKLNDTQMAMLMAALVAIMPFSIDAYLPAIPAMASALNADIHRVEQSIGSFILGVALGQLLGGSLSDVKGRRNIALLGLLLYIVGSLALIVIQTVEQLTLLRTVQALGAGMTSVVVGAIIRDNYEGRKAAQMFALIGIIMMVAPLLAPMLGAVLSQWLGWRTVFVFLLLYASVVLLVLYRFLPQYKKAEPLSWGIVPQSMMRYRRVFTTRNAMGFLFFQAASFASMLVFLTESPFVYMEIYGLDSQQYAWVFACNILAMAVFNRITAWGLRRNWQPRLILLAGIALQLMAGLAMAIMVWTMKQPPLWALVGAVMISVGTQGLIVANTQALFMGYFKEEGGSANAVLSSSQSLLGALTALLATVLHNGTIKIMASMMPMCCICGAILLYFCSRNVWQNTENAKQM